MTDKVTRRYERQQAQARLRGVQVAEQIRQLLSAVR